jgi:diadenosine tetraphosphate (Ap4A) HIT family hydrolase
MLVRVSSSSRRESERKACPLCDDDLGPLLAEGTHWNLILNRNQDLVGKCFLVARRHVERVPDLTDAEWAELRDVIRLATSRLRSAFEPDHFNYSFLQNVDRHVHLHVIPRYARTRTVGGVQFHDAAFPDHYAVDSARAVVDKAVLGRIIDVLRSPFAPM